MRPLLVILVSLLSTSYSFSSCEEISDLSSVTLSNGQEFKYRFLKGTDPSLPTVVYLPGGPGQGSINNEDPRLSGSYGFIQTDPRGVGCNSKLYDPNINLSSNDLALDIAALIKKESLSNYIIYGVSYGTLLATIVTHHIESDPQIPNPQSIVLEGVLGRAFKPHEEDQAAIKEWEVYKNHAVLLDLFKQQEPSLGFSSLEIGEFIKGMLSYGKNPYNPDYYLIENYFNLLQQEAEQREILIDTIKRANEPFSSDLVNLYRQIGCEEITSLGWKHDAYYRKGELVLDQSTRGVCDGFSFTEGFDSAKYQLTSKIYYFNGTNDPATPLWQAKYHAQNQTKALKNTVTVQGGGHNPLSYNLEDCQPKIWDKILSNSLIDQDFLDANCALKTVTQ